MHRIEAATKRDPERRWALPDRVFFACGVCHILAFAFLQRYAPKDAPALWLKPDRGYTGNHIVVAGAGWVFDYHGYSGRRAFLEHTVRKARRWWPSWDAARVELPRQVLVSEERSREYEGLWFREPCQFLHDALPRAEEFIDRFPPPPGSF